MRSYGGKMTESYMPWLSGAFGLIGASMGARAVSGVIPIAALRWELAKLARPHEFANLHHAPLETAQ